MRPMCLTDVIHLINDIRRGYSIWIITLALIPQYLMFMFVGMEAYVLSLVNLGRYLQRLGGARLTPMVELVIHVPLRHWYFLRPLSAIQQLGYPHPTRYPGHQRR